MIARRAASKACRAASAEPPRHRQHPDRAAFGPAVLRHRNRDDHRGGQRIRRQRADVPAPLHRHPQRVLLAARSAAGRSAPSGPGAGLGVPAPRPRHRPPHRPARRIARALARASGPAFPPGCTGRGGRARGRGEAVGRRSRRLGLGDDLGRRLFGCRGRLFFGALVGLGIRRDARRRRVGDLWRLRRFGHRKRGHARRGAWLRRLGGGSSGDGVSGAGGTRAATSSLTSACAGSGGSGTCGATSGSAGGFRRGLDHRVGGLDLLGWRRCAVRLRALAQRAARCRPPPRGWSAAR